MLTSSGGVRKKHPLSSTQPKSTPSSGGKGNNVFSPPPSRPLTRAHPGVVASGEALQQSEVKKPDNTEALDDESSTSYSSVESERQNAFGSDVESFPDGASELSYVSDTCIGPSSVEPFGHSPVSRPLRLKILKQQMADRAKLRSAVYPKTKKMKSSRESSVNSSRVSSRVASRRATLVARRESRSKSLLEEKSEPVSPEATVTETPENETLSKRAEEKEQAENVPPPPSKKDPGTGGVIIKRRNELKGKVLPVKKGVTSHVDPNIPLVKRSERRPITIHSQKEVYPESPSTLTTGQTFSKEPLLPPLINAAEMDRTLTVVFDLDETLCNNRCVGPAQLRPGATLLLKSLRELLPSPVSKDPNTSTSVTTRLYEQSIPRFKSRSTSLSIGSLELPGARLEIVLWTASVEIVARPVVHRLDPKGEIFDHLIYRDIRWYREASYAKDLRRLGRRLDNVVIVENAPASVALNRSNAILVNDFVHNRSDRQLYVVRSVLQEWIKRSDHRLRRASFSSETPAVEKGKVEGKRVKSTYVGPLHQTLLDKMKLEEEAKKANGEGGEALNPSDSARIGAPQETVEVRPIPIATFLYQHPYMSPGTNYVKVSAAREVMMKRGLVKAKKAECDSPDASGKENKTSTPRMKTSKTPPQYSCTIDGKIRPKMPLSLDPMTPSSAPQPLGGAADVPPPPPSPPKTSSEKRGEVSQKPVKGRATKKKM